MTSPVEVLAQIGQALYGERWKRPMAKELRTDHKTIWRWLNGKSRIDSHTIDKLMDAIELRKLDNKEESKLLDKLLIEIKKIIRQQETAAVRADMSASRKN